MPPAVRVESLRKSYELLFAPGIIWLATRLFRSDRLVTGDAGRLQR